MGVAQMDNEARAWQIAANRARQDLAYQLRTSVENMQVDYGNVTGMSSGVDFFSSASRQLSDLVLTGARVIKRGVGPKKTYYVQECDHQRQSGRSCQERGVSGGASAESNGC
ncbi:MAG: hypothetical protein LBK00_07365 [Treponema sp.]|jgi:hypothetical protein|nr:hypothetical protein [Treponema sp.]